MVADSCWRFLYVHILRTNSSGAADGAEFRFAAALRASMFQLFGSVGPDAAEMSSNTAGDRPVPADLEDRTRTLLAVSIDVLASYETTIRLLSNGNDSSNEVTSS